MMRAITFMLVLCSPLTASAADIRYIMPTPRHYGTPLIEAERRSLQAETYRLQRDQAEDLRRLRNDLEDRDHEQKMERFRERLRDPDR